MTLEQLQAMKDNDLNELAAINVMGWIKEDLKSFDRSRYVANDGSYISCHAWNPCTDMNDAMQLLEIMAHDTKYSDVTITYPWCVVADWRPLDDESGWGIRVDTEDSLPRSITIAAILAKEEQHGPR